MYQNRKKRVVKTCGEAYRDYQSTVRNLTSKSCAQFRRCERSMLVCFYRGNINNQCIKSKFSDDNKHIFKQGRTIVFAVVSYCIYGCNALYKVAIYIEVKLFPLLFKLNFTQ